MRRQRYGVVCALDSRGRVHTWGWNLYGPLGLGDTTNRSQPTRVTGVSGIVAIAAGEMSAYALRHDGTIFAWGSNSNGQLGNSSAGYFETTPVMVDIIATRIPLRPEVSMPLPSVMTAASGPGVTTRLGNWATPASIGGPLPRAWKKVPRVHPWSLVWPWAGSAVGRNAPRKGQEAPLAISTPFQPTGAQPGKMNAPSPFGEGA